MRRSVTALIVTIGVLAASSTASAYELRGFDPDDRAEVGADPDIRSTVVRVERGKDDRVLNLFVRAYEDFGLWWSIEARIDARGGSRADHVVYLWNADNSGDGCRVSDLRGKETYRGRFRQRDDTVRCRVPIRFLEPDKPIRWRLVSATQYPDDGELERAPDHGMYG